jgi:branched-chain amino acid transport system substrate-binding protein
MGGEIDAIESFEVEATDFRTQLRKITLSNPKAIFIVGASKHVGMIVKQAKELGIKTQFIASSPVEGEEVLTIAGELANGIIYPYPYDIESEDKNQEAFRIKYKEKYKMLPEMLAANAFDALMIVAEMIDKYGYNVEKIKDGLYKIKNYHGASGVLSFDKNGDVHKPIIIKKIENGRFVRY